jgi:hypothetical protein
MGGWWPTDAFASRRGFPSFLFRSQETETIALRWQIRKRAVLPH